MPDPLPLRANLEWLKKLAKERLAELRQQNPQATLSDSQLALARAYGFPSWRKLKSHVEQVRGTLEALVPDAREHAALASAVLPDDPDLAGLFAAIDAGNTRQVQEILTRRRELAAARGPQGQTPLHAAARCDDPQLGVILLSCGADMEAKFGESGHTPLSWAVTCNAMSFARAMVKLGSKPDLFCAAGIGLLDQVQAFFDASGNLRPGASRTGSSRFAPDGRRLPCPPETPREQISDALYLACRSGQGEVVRFLLTKQPDLSFRAYLGGTPLHWAHFSGSRTAIELLEQAGADTAARDDVFHCTPRAFGICVPANWGIHNLVWRQLGEDPGLANLMDGQTSALHQAAAGGQAEIVRILLKNGADPTARDANGQTARDLAEQQGHAEVAKML